MKYVLLLRGINVGGNSPVKMADLKKTVENCGFTNVRTYIQSGNVIFESNDKPDKINARLEEALSRDFGLGSRAILRNYEQFKTAVTDVPDDWRKTDDLRRYMAFIREPLKAKDVIVDFEPKKDVDFVEAGEGVIYMSTLLSGLTKSGFTKLVTKKIYKDITIRNYTTAQKILAILEE
jgi:uncharacterized protein (DUF1697 family)